MATHYEILGVSRQASESEIKTAWKKATRENHPDKNKSPDATQKIQEINAAYEVLSDSTKKREYNFLLDNPEPPEPPFVPENMQQDSTPEQTYYTAPSQGYKAPKCTDEPASAEFDFNEAPYHAPEPPRYSAGFFEDFQTAYENELDMRFTVPNAFNIYVFATSDESPLDDSVEIKTNKDISAVFLHNIELQLLLLTLQALIELQLLFLRLPENQASFSKLQSDQQQFHFRSRPRLDDEEEVQNKAAPAA